MDKSNKKKYLQYAFHVAVLVGLIIAGMRYIDGAEFTRALHRFNWVYAPFILILSVVYVAVKAWRFAVQIKELTGRSRWLVVKGYFAAQAATLLPGGIAARAGIMDQVGVKVEDGAASTALSSLSDQVVLITVALISALWFESARRPVMILLSVLVVFSILLGIEAVRTWLSRIVEMLMGKLNVLEHWRGFLQSLKNISTPGILIGGVLNAVFAFAIMAEALDLAARGVGMEVPYSRLLFAFALPSLLGRISAMPGGIGVTEAGMVGILDTAPGVSLAQASAAVLIFRIGTIVFAALVGTLIYFFSWRPTVKDIEQNGQEKPGEPKVQEVSR